MLKRRSIFILCLAAVLGFAACGSRAGEKEPDASEESRIRVCVTFNALKEFAEAVGQDRVEVTTIIPDGKEAHGFEPKARDLSGLRSAQVFVYSGLGMEAWVEEAVKAAGNRDLLVLDASEGADVLVWETASEGHAGDAGREEGAEDGEDGHAHGEYDPHLWLGIKGAQSQARNIKDALTEADPGNRDYYENNCDSFIAQLERLYTEYRAKFEALENKNFVTGHAAFGYLCRDMGLVQNSVQDIYAEGEPSAQQLAALVEFCRENHVTTIFAEETASPAVSQTLADEVGARLETIYTMESAEDGKSYLERMEENLRKIYESLSE